MRFSTYNCLIINRLRNLRLGLWSCLCMKEMSLLSLSIPSVTIFFFLLHLLKVTGSLITSVLNRHDFPPGFVFGSGSSAYQIEGAVAEDGRKPSIWDTYTHAGRIKDKSTGDISADQYHKYKEDVKLMHETGLDAYRFSFSWSRIIPDGHGDVNPKGLSYYNNLINELVSYGIEPHVTLSHLDYPQSLEDEYRGFLSPKIMYSYHSLPNYEDFTMYADTCFKEFGDRVKHWMTFSEPNIQTVMSNDVGIIPPARCSYPFGVNCSEGDSTTEPYISAHNILLSHAAAANLYKEKYQEKQRGRIGITLLACWLEPSMDSPRDIAATERALAFHLGWFLDPLLYGKYPTIMRKIVGSRLPVFSKNDAKRLSGSCDFIGLNHYGLLYVQDLSIAPDKYGSDYIRDASVLVSFEKSIPAKNFISLKSHDEMLPKPWGLQRLLEYVKLNYNNLAVMIHENGYTTYGDDSSKPAARNDNERIQYLGAYIESLLPSIRNGSNVVGYFMWAFMDGFEWMFGYTARYGLYGVDFNDPDRKRYPRLSAHWYSEFLSKSRRKTEAYSS